MESATTTSPHRASRSTRSTATGVAVTGYQASNNVTVIVRDIAKTGPLIDAAAAAAGDHITVGGVSFFVDDVEAVMGAARADAINNARKRAQEYAAAAGVTVGGVSRSVSCRSAVRSRSSPGCLAFKAMAELADTDRDRDAGPHRFGHGGVRTA